MWEAAFMDKFRTRAMGRAIGNFGHRNLMTWAWVCHPNLPQTGKEVRKSPLQAHPPPGLRGPLATDSIVVFHPAIRMIGSIKPRHAPSFRNFRHWSLT
jgi:hypothetical protein